MLRRICFSLLLFSGLASAQPLGAGLIWGVPATDAFHTTAFSAQSHFYLVGPYVEVRLPAKMAVEMDALYRSYDFQGVPAHSWDFPIVLKHRFLPGPVRPFFEAGVSFSHLSDIRLSSLQHRSNYGIVAGGGVELKLLPVRIAPQIRYTGWTFHNFDGQVQSNRNQVAVLFAIGF